MPKTIIASLGLALTFLAIASTEMQAKPQSHNIQFDRHDPRGFGAAQPAAVKVASVKAAGLKQMRRKHQRRHYDRPAKTRHYAAKPHRQSGKRTIAAQIVAHPPGCPSRSFCGCGTSLYLLGKAVRQGGLAIARNWLAFPRVACAPRMAAARPGHVFAIIECLGGNKVLAYDPNSGRRQTRIHVRDLRRYAIVNPHGGSRYAAVQ